MSIREREGLIARVRQMRRVAGADEDRVPPLPRTLPAEDDGLQTPAADDDGLQALAARIAELETLVQGLQDSVHRESTRQTNRLADLEARLQPAALGRALSEDARNRGL